jgi:P-type conjugative transfer protein TrbJ
MTACRLRTALAAGAAVLALATASVPASAQWIVYDPTNFSQNILTAARELQQVNNEIQSLENQATMLINQARNLASQPYSALAQLEQSISRTEQLLMQAQRIAYSVTTIDQAFTQSYPQTYPSSTSSQQLLAGAQTRWQNSLAGFQDAMRVQAGAVQNLSEPVRDWRAPGGGGRQPAYGTPDQATRRSHRRHGGDRTCAEPGRRAKR